MTEKHSPLPGSLRVWWVPQLPMKPFLVGMESPQQAQKLLEVLAHYDLFQYENRVKPDYSNAGGLEIFANGEWEEWESEEWDDIGHWTPPESITACNQHETLKEQNRRLREALAELVSEVQHAYGYGCPTYPNSTTMQNAERILAETEPKP